MENNVINLWVVAQVAAGLKELNEKVVFVGGSVVSLYVDDPAADEVRPTADVDITVNVVNISSLSVWEQFQQDLSSLGFYSDPNGHAICSYRYQNIPIDIMASEDGPLGPSNRWYKKGFRDIQKVEVKDQIVNILSAPYYLATKFEAFKNRGKDFRTSHDMEDIIYILDNRTNIVEEIINADQEVKEFIVSQLEKLTSDGILEEVLMSHIHPIMIDERLPIVEEKIAAILKL